MDGWKALNTPGNSSNTLKSSGNPLKYATDGNDGTENDENGPGIARRFAVGECGGASSQIEWRAALVAGIGGFASRSVGAMPGFVLAPGRFETP